MFCYKCGYQINDNDSFCTNCGKRYKGESLLKEFGNHFFESTTRGKYDKTSYSIFEEFFKPASLLDHELYFAITDRSIIINKTEYPFSDLSVIDTFEESLFACAPETTINGEKFYFKVKKADSPRLWIAIMHANEKIELHSFKEKVKYAISLGNTLFNIRTHLFLLEGESLHTSLSKYLSPVDEYDYPFQHEVVDEEKSKSLPELERKLLQEYSYAQNLLTDLFVENNLAPKEYSEARRLHDLVDFIAETDTDINPAIERYLEAKREEAIQRQIEREENLARAEAGEFDNRPHEKGSSVFGDIAKIATGVAIGNRMSRPKSKNKPKPENHKYTCDFRCPYYTKSYGPTRCKRNPQVCGHGLRYW